MIIWLATLMAYALPVNDIFKHCNKILLNLETNPLAYFTKTFQNGFTQHALLRMRSALRMRHVQGTDILSHMSNLHPSFPYISSDDLSLE